MTTTASLAPRPRLSHFRQAMLSLFWFATNAHWAAILITTLPNQSLMMGGDRIKGETLGTVLAIGAFVSMLTAPIFGAFSDRLITRWGRRRPWLVIGTVMNIAGLLGLAYFPRANDLSSLPLFILAFMWVEFWNNVATGPYAALIPDLVPAEQRGSASGWYGMMSVLGNFAGGVAGLIFTQNGVTDIVGIYYYIAVILVLGTLGTVIFVKEPSVTRKPPPFRWGEFWRGLITPLRDHDFRWVFLTRFLMMMGFFTVQQFLQYYARDVVKDFTLFGVRVAENAEAAASFFIIALLVGAVISSLVAGILSYNLGRKKMVYAASGLQAIVPFLLIFSGSFTFVVGLGIVFGLGYGAYGAVDWAMASDVLPSEADHAKDMGVWHVADTLPQVVAVPIAGRLLDHFQSVGQQQGAPNLGYTIIFSLTVVYFILGTVFVRKIRKVR